MGAFSFLHHFHSLPSSATLSSLTCALTFASECVSQLEPRVEAHSAIPSTHRRDATLIMAFNVSLLSRGRDTLRAANRGNAVSQAEVGSLHQLSAGRLDLLQGAPADEEVVAARWAEALRYLESAAEQGVADAQDRTGTMYATGRGVEQDWDTAVMWWRKAADAGDMDSQWSLGQCYYYGGRGVDRDVAQAMEWFRRAAAQGCPPAARAVQRGTPGEDIRVLMADFTNAESAVSRHPAAHEFVAQFNEIYILLNLKPSSNALREPDCGVAHPSPRDSVWMDFMLTHGLSDDELQLAKKIHAYSQRFCAFCGSTSAPLRSCSRCMEVRFCIDTDCQYRHWNSEPREESHKVLCPRIYVRGSKGRTLKA